MKSLTVRRAATNSGHILLPDSELQMLEPLINLSCILRMMSF
jgi:hypothetical protein